MFAIVTNSYKIFGFDHKGDPKGVGFSLYQVRDGVLIEQ
jgi:hypothetical protein